MLLRSGQYEFSDEIEIVPGYTVGDLVRDARVATDSAIAAARSEQREIIREAAQQFVEFLGAIPERRPDNISMTSIDKLVNGEVYSIAITVGDFRRLAAAIRNGTGAADEGEAQT